MTLVLASGSAIRRELLEAAGLSFVVDVSDADENAAKAELRAQGASPRQQALALAELKALNVARRRSELVIGADQMLAVDDDVLDKPRDLAEARSHLMRLRGREHSLMCAVAVAQNGVVLWRHLATPRLRAREFSNEFLESYLARVGDVALASVGAYQLEGLGAQLFETLDGDYFSVLGLPLLPLMAFLREQGALAS